MTGEIIRSSRVSGAAVLRLLPAVDGGQAGGAGVLCGVSHFPGHHSRRLTGLSTPGGVPDGGREAALR
eukprot:7378810-Prymnesium_polylepis.1